MTSFTQNLLIAIGINNYCNGIAELKTARPDAEKLADVLAKDYKYQVELITDETDRKPTFAELTHLLLEELPQKLRSGEKSRLLFYFAGHGMPLESDDGPRGFLLPQDANPNPKPGESNNFLSMQVLHDALITLPCHHLLIILDCCFAGTFRWASTRKLIPLPETLHREHYDRFIRYPAWQVITSAAHNQEALDFLTDKRGISSKSQQEATLHSPFAQALFDALQDGVPNEKGIRYKKADLTEDGVITASELYLYLRDSVETRSEERQTPGIYPLKKHDRGEYIFHDPNFDPNSLSKADPVNEANNPYRGLNSFEEQHARFFFGRQELIEQLCERITTPDHPFTVVLGVSGSGKSSLVKAGLIPYLKAIAFVKAYILTQAILTNLPLFPLKLLPLTGVNQEVVLDPMRPGESPFTALAKTLFPITIISNPTPLPSLEFLSHVPQQKIEQLNDEERLLSIRNLSQQLQTNPDRFPEIIHKWSQQNPNANLLLVIDQFEELITLSRSPQPENLQAYPGESQQFLQLLERSLTANLPYFRIVVTLRSDFEPRFLNSEILKSYWTKARFPVRAMRSDELRQAIEGPASETALYFEPANLVDRLIDEVGQMPGALPLLSFTLSELYLKLAEKWRKRETSDRALTIDAEFDKEGGVAGSLTRRANEEYRKLSEDSNLGEAAQQTMRRIMLRMLTLEGGEITRRRVLDSELIYPTQEESDRVKQVVDRLINARLLVKGQLETGEPYVEPAHDFLVRGWGTLQDWINEEKAKETLELQQRLTAQATDWDRSNRPDGLLLPDGDLLKRLEELHRAAPNWFNQRETELIQSSIKQAKKNQARLELPQKSERIQNLLHQKQRLDGLILAIQAIGQNLEELSEEILSPVQTCLQWAIEHGRVPNTFQADSLIQSIAFSPNSEMIASGIENNVQIWNLKGEQLGKPFQGHTGKIRHLVFSPDGKMIASSSEDGTIRLWDLEGRQKQLLSGHGSSVVSIGFSPDGRRIISGSTDRTLRLWRLDCVSSNIVFEGHERPISSVVFSPDGEVVASVSFDRTLRLWRLDGRQAQCFQLGTVLESVAFSSSGKMLACGGRDNRTYLWDLENQQKWEFHEGFKVTSIAFSPNSKTIASTSEKHIRLRNLSSDLIEELFQESTAFIKSVIFSPNGKTLASNSGKTICLWDLNSKLIQPLYQGQKNNIYSAIFNSRGDIVISGSEDGYIRLWDLNTGELIERSCQAAVLSVAFTPDSKGIVSADANGRTYFWRLENNHFVQQSSQEHEGINSVTFSSRGSIVSGDGYGRLSLWKLENEDLVEQSFQRHNSAVTSLAFSSDGKLLASCSEKGEICLWRIDNNQLVKQISQTVHSVTSIAFSPDQKTVILGSFGEGVRSWNLCNNSIQRTITEVDTNSVTFDPTGKTILSSCGKTLRLWDLEGNALGDPFQEHNEAVLSVAFSPDGKKIVSSGSDGAVYLWHGNWEAWLQVCCDRLRYHPIFKNPDSIGNQEQREIAIAACETCKKYIWKEGKID